MKTKIIILSILVAGISAFAFKGIFKTNNVPWTSDQVMPAETLANIINNPKAKKPVIFNIGFVENIKDATHIGPVSVAKNVEIFKKKLATMAKNTPIVFYCGCCPFEHCPNIRPAFKILKSMGFTDVKVLDLQHNLKTDWMAKGYPMAKE